jgi:TolB protein
MDQRSRLLRATRSGVVLVALMACGALTPCSAAAAATSSVVTLSPLANGAQGTPAEIPWGAVGPGWSLALWSTSYDPVGPYTLYLVDPAGGRYAITTFPSPAPGTWLTIADWSGDKHRALLSDNGYASTVIEVELATGRVLHRFTVTNLLSAQYTRPLGLDLLISDVGSLYRAYPNGGVQATFPTSFTWDGTQATYSEDSTPLYTPDGTELVRSTSAGMAVVLNNGDLVRVLASPNGYSCSPVRWWSAGEVLSSCYAGSGPTPTGEQLWLVPISGSTPTALTALVTPYGAVQREAWKIPSGTYVQDFVDACSGAWWLARLNANLTTTGIGVPGAVGNVFVLGSYGDQLELVTSINCTQVGPPAPMEESLLLFNPMTGAMRVLLGPGLKGCSKNGGTVVDAMMFQGLDEARIQFS